tara:strand:- start:410 stop:610 length:201 start_codon:yes stop_codon:yes gene_type:complete
MKESIYQALKMAEEYHSQKYASNSEQSYPTITEILATAREIFDFIILINEDGIEEEDFPLNVEDVV